MKLPFTAGETLSEYTEPSLHVSVLRTNAVLCVSPGKNAIEDADQEYDDIFDE